MNNGRLCGALYSYLMGEIGMHEEVGSTKAAQRVASVNRRRDQLSGEAAKADSTAATEFFCKGIITVGLGLYSKVTVRLSGSSCNIEPAMWLATEYGDTMNRRVSLATILLCIGACASSGPEAPAPAATDPSAGAVAVASDIPSAPPEGVIHDPNAPVVEVSASALAASKSDEIVCRKERQSGTRMTTRVCRTRAEIEGRAAKDQEALRNSRATQSGSACVMDGSC